MSYNKFQHSSSDDILEPEIWDVYENIEKNRFIGWTYSKYTDNFIESIDLFENYEDME